MNIFCRPMKFHQYMRKGFYIFLAVLLKRKIYTKVSACLPYDYSYTNSKNCSKSLIRIYVPAFLLSQRFYPVRTCHGRLQEKFSGSQVACRKTSHRRLSESRNKLSEKGCRKEFRILTRLQCRRGKVRAVQRDLKGQGARDKPQPGIRLRYQRVQGMAISAPPGGRQVCLYPNPRTEFSLRN